MSLKDYSVLPIPFEQTKEWLLYKHYAHTIPNIIYAFGLYDEKKILQAICCYGTPANNHNNAMGEFKQIELVRLVSNENLPKNTLSFFVSKTFNYLEKPLSIISYADIGKNHNGYIYQAMNWRYTGKGGGVDFYVDREKNEIHSRIMSDLRLQQPTKTRKQIAEERNWKLTKGTYKHRYFYFLGSKGERKKWVKTILEKYTFEIYPKGKNIQYNASYTPKVQRILF